MYGNCIDLALHQCTTLQGNLYRVSVEPTSTVCRIITPCLQNCDLSGSDLQHANLRGANIEGASLQDVVI